MGFPQDEDDCRVFEEESPIDDEKIEKYANLNSISDHLKSEKMSKSTGNCLTLSETIDKFSTDDMIGLG